MTQMEFACRCPLIKGFIMAIFIDFIQTLFYLSVVAIRAFGLSIDRNKAQAQYDAFFDYIFASISLVISLIAGFNYIFVVMRRSRFFWLTHLYMFAKLVFLLHIFVTPLV